MRLAGKVAVVTDVTSDIGRAIAQKNKKNMRKKNG
jgi:NAD(P)-dependent dehydrogenase (short-subunit alcohol dehydrogenase family)